MAFPSDSSPGDHRDPEARKRSRRTLLEQRLRAPVASSPDEARLQDGSGKPDSAPFASGAIRPSFGQEQMWILEQLDPGKTVYNIARLYQLSGALDVGALERSVQEIVRRHETLRTVLRDVDGRPESYLRDAGGFSLPVTDLSDKSEEERIKLAEQLAHEQARAPFDLARDLFLRPHLYRLAADSHLLLVATHHIAWDAWSASVFWSELGALYEAFRSNQPAFLEPLRMQYADFATSQRNQLQGDRLRNLLDYWHSTLSGASHLALPTQRPRPVRQSFRGATIDFVVPADLLSRLQTFARGEHATLYMVLLAGYNLWLHRLSGQDDIVVGTGIAGRDSAGVEPLIGYFVNTLAMRTRVEGSTGFRRLVQRVRTVVLSAFEHQRLPFEKLVAELRLPRDLSRHQLFQTALVMHNTPAPRLSLAGLAVREIPVAGTVAHFDLMVTLAEREGELRGRCEFATDLFDASVVREWLDCYAALLDKAIRDPDEAVERLPMLSERQRNQMLAQWNNTHRDYPQELCLHELVERQVDRTPEAVAVRFENRQLTYGELDRRANLVARHLQDRGIRSGALVGVCMERSLEMVIGLLAVLKAGGAYVPLDPTHPKKRLADMIADAGTGLVLTQQHLLDELSPCDAEMVCLDRDWTAVDQEDTTRPSTTATPTSPAYMIYTSGSTGRPKGALNAHGGVVNRLLWMQEYLRLTAADTILQKTPYTFDVSVWEFFLPLIGGAQLVLARPGGHQDPDYLLELIATRQVTILHFVPSMLRVFLEAPGLERFASVRDVICSGEALPATVVHAFHGRCRANLHNLYGPTEAAIDVTAWLCPRAWEGTNVPIGRPVANTRCYILDAAMQPVPVGAPGELYLGGIQVGPGYHRRAELTAERFIPDPFGGEMGGRLYRTGDLCQYRDDGNIEFLGRIDHQVKLRGFRIELGEIEAVLARHAAVRQVVVVAQEDAPDQVRLVAYLVLHDGAHVAAKEWHRFAAVSLPDHMIPSAFVVLAELPLSPNGKIDRSRLLVAGRRPPHNDLPSAIGQSVGGRDVGSSDPAVGKKADGPRMEHACVHEWFEAHARNAPNQPAVMYEGTTLTYGELNRRASLLAGRLRQHIAGPDAVVAVWADRSPDVIVGMLAALKAGAAFLPIDPLLPADRVVFLLGDARVAALLIQAGLVDRLPLREIPVIALDQMSWSDHAEPEARGRSPVPGDLAYVIYTSGSTGRPKGVAVEHRNLVNYLVGITERFGFQPGMTHAVVSTLAADLGYTVVFGALCTGGCLHVISPERATSQASLAEYFRRHRIDVLKIVPSHLRALQTGRNPGDVMPRKILILGGEASTLAWIRSLGELAPECAIFNHYGPTETTVGVTTFAAGASIPDTLSQTLPLGRPLPNVRGYVVDENLQRVPEGVAGELCIAGRNVARGYHRHPDLTAEKFLPDPFHPDPHERLYRTGDRVRLLPDGNFEFLGRIDSQVKVRGHRVEPGEIEATLRVQPGVRDAVVVPRTDASGATQLVAYVVPEDGAVIPAGQAFHQLPNGLQIAHLNRNETEYIYREIFELQAYLRHGITLRDGDCVIDVGANIGLFTVFAHQLAHDLRVLAFEPNPVVFPLLETNARIHGRNVKCFPTGLADSSRQATLTFFEGFSLLSGFHADERTEREVVKRYALNQSAGAAGAEGDHFAAAIDELLQERFRARTMTTELRTLSQVVADEGVERIDLLKINAEKSELDILRGIRLADWPRIQQLVIEVDQTADLASVVTLLELHGFEACVEQDPLLRQTELCYVYAIRPAADRRLQRDQTPHAHLRRLPAAAGSAPTAQSVREYLGERLPDYMVPQSVVFLSALPLSANGKIDRTALPASDQAAAKPSGGAPQNHREKVLLTLWQEMLGRDAIGTEENFFDLGGDSIRAIQIANRARDSGLEISARQFFEHQTITALAAVARETQAVRTVEILQRIWQSVLRLDHVGIDENFFELGGDSILAIQIANQARKAGLEIAPHRVFERQTVAELARLVSESSTETAENEATTSGPVPLTPIQRWFFEHKLTNPHHWNQAITVDLATKPDVAILEEAWRAVIRHHDAFRLRFHPTADGWRQELPPPTADRTDGTEIPFLNIDLADMSEESRDASIAEISNELNSGLNIQTGPLVQAAHFALGNSHPGRLFVTAHHLVVDGVSWRVLLDDLALAYEQMSRGDSIQLPAPTMPFAQWARRLSHHAGTAAMNDEAAYWLARRGPALPLLNSDVPNSGPAIEATTEIVTTALSVADTAGLVLRIPPVFNTRINDVLLAGLLWAANRQTGARSLSLFLEGHGRIPRWSEVDVSRTVGWFTTMYPVDLELGEAASCDAVLCSVKEQLRRIPENGAGYGVLRFPGDQSTIAAQLKRQPEPRILFNYLGQMDRDASKTNLLGQLVYGTGRTRSARNARIADIEITSQVIRHRLEVRWRFSRHLHQRQTVEALADAYIDVLREFVAQCPAHETRTYTPSDFSSADLTQEELDGVLRQLDEDI